MSKLLLKIKVPFLAMLVMLCFSALGQKTISVRISGADDDQEEWLAAGSGQTQSKTVGLLDAGSSDLELGTEASGNDPQMVGLRFMNINIPKGAIILSAYLQFTVDAVNKNSDPCNLYIRGEASDSAKIFNTTVNYNITSRSKTNDSVFWAVTGASWGTVGAATLDQRSPNIKKLIDAIIGRANWKTGNPLSFFIYGKGTREVESFDGDAAKAPMLIITYVEPVSLAVRISAADDDQEEWIPAVAPKTQAKTVGLLDAGSSDLELGTEASGNDPQMVGMRFNNINVPKGSIITNAYIQFTVDATNKNNDPCVLNIKAENADSSVIFDPSKNYNITSRSRTTDSVIWSVSGSTWATVGAATPDQRTPNVKTLVEKIMNRSGWKSGNPLTFFITGTGTREIESFDGDAPKAPLLVIEYIPIKSIAIRVNAADDDQEEWIPASGTQTQAKTVGLLDAGSSDLELGTEASGNDPQIVGIRFNNVGLPNGAIIQNAYIQFTVDAVNKNNDPCVIYIKGEDNDTPSIFNPSINYNISKRTKTKDSITWNVSGTTWATVGAATVDQRTPNLKGLIEGLVGRKGWKEGNSLALFLYGKGTREVESYDGDAPKSPLLVIEYLGGDGGPVTKPRIPLTTYPIVKKSNWLYFDSASAPKGNWKNQKYANDSTWSFGKGVLGYGELGFTGTDISSGPSNNKNLTAYFRKPFLVNTTLLSDTLELQLLCDDGAAVYVNGTEVARKNLPTGTLGNRTKANVTSESPFEKVYWLYYIPKTLLKQDTNVIAVEVHQYDSLSSDLLFDLALSNRIYKANNPGLGCTAGSDHISCFTSVIPSDQVDTLRIPSTHHFQRFLKTADSYSKGGSVLSNFDFTGYVPIKGNSKKGYVAINHERNPGGVSLLDVHFNCATGYWVVDSVNKIDFGGELVKTASNCSGGITPWGTTVTCEEDAPAGDANADGYEDIGWNVEIDPVTRKVKEYGNGKREKLWAMGRMSHENIVFKMDSITSYYGEDEPTGNVYKFVAAKKTDLSSGTLYALKLNAPLDASGDPTGTTGTWVVVPNTSKNDRNYTQTMASLAGATPFNGVEDVEINPVNGDLYFAAKGVGRTYRFTDNGTTVSNFITYVGGKTYPINYGSGVVAEDWGGGNDNLTFDDKGNLYVLQDGGRNHVWMVRNDHTQANPKIELFMTTPSGSEPTGMTFSPDYKYMFISIQEPNGKEVQKDVKGDAVTFDRSTALVVARKENFKPFTLKTPSITGLGTVKMGTTNSYSVTKNPGSTFNWNAVNGNLVSGQTTNQVNILWNKSGNSEVNVTEVINTQCSSSVSKLNVVVETVGIRNVEVSEGIQIYPNPAHDKIMVEIVEAGNGTIRITDMNGKLIISTAVVDGKNSIDVSSLISGLYTVTVIVNEKEFHAQLIKK